jgi:prolyl 4-hydroxylase
MNDMFSSIERDFGDRYDITVMSTDPWVVVFDNFVSEEEINAMISTVEGNWERSTDTGQENQFGEVGRTLSTGRTSSNAWCRHNCMTHPNVEHLTSKIQEITRIPSNHYESYQILQYDVGQYYRMHHDMGP